MRRLLVGVAVAMLWCGTASAENWSKVRCEDPRVIEFIKQQMKAMKFEDGTPVANYLGDNSKMTAKTVSAQRDRFICQINLNVTYAGSSERIRGKFIFREFPGGKASVTFMRS